ncbi:MAG: hypothetical protein HC857_03970 [Synechococcales cyanobacterium RU_4_20]|nr:hypothetical protein [Synechococcales cyanobacterium RU_4_20]
MDPEQRQRIIGYFLEESQEYLEQLEPGVQDLASALADPERINELYRAAHSIKGGAAMLELHGIQKVSYRLESSLKYIKGHPSIQPNAEIEASLLQGVEGLKQLIQELRATSRLSEESSAVVWQTTEPVFDQLDQILAQRVEQAEASLAEPSAPLPATAASADPAADLLLAAAAEAELLDADIFGELAANRESADNLGDFSWEDMEDLADLSDLNSAIAAKPWTTEASGDGPEVFIEGLDELANLFEENPWTVTKAGAKAAIISALRFPCLRLLRWVRRKTMASKICLMTSCWVLRVMAIAGRQFGGSGRGGLAWPCSDGSPLRP